MQLKKALSSYQVDVKIKIGYAARNYAEAPFSIVLKSSTGNDISLNFLEEKVWMNDSKLDKINFNGKINMISIAKIENEIVATINGKSKLYIEDETFTDLKEVSIPFTSVKQDYNRFSDELFDLSIAGE